MPLAPGRWAVQDNAVPIPLAKNANALSQPDNAVLCAAQGNTAGGPLANGRSLALPGSKDCNRGSATPSDARGLQAYHCKPAPGRGKAARRGRLGDGWDRSASCPAWCLMG